MRNFIVAVLLCVLVWLMASKVYANTRAANAFDELCYSTLDARSGLALYYGRVSPTVLASVLSACKSDPPRGKGSDGGRVGHPLEGGLGEGSAYEFNYSKDRNPDLDGFERLSWDIQDESEESYSPVISGKCLFFNVLIPPQ